MKGPCTICEQIVFIGVCPHGMAEHVWPEPAIVLDEEDKQLFSGLMEALTSKDPAVQDEFSIRLLARWDWAEGK